jgi:hypothetical protein
MKKISSTKRRGTGTRRMRAEYRFDYKQARPNRFAGQIKQQLIVLIDEDVSKVFTTPKSVNKALRAVMSAVPKISKVRKTA